MYKHILVATDGSELAMRGLDQGLELAKLAGAELTVVTVTEPAVVVGGGFVNAPDTIIDPMPELIEAQEKRAKTVLEEAVAHAAAAGVTVRTDYIDNQFAADGIVAAAEKAGADLIVMGSHGRSGLGKLLLGSETSNVLAHTKIAVLVTR